MDTLALIALLITTIVLTAVDSAEPFALAIAKTIATDGFTTWLKNRGQYRK
ncbi:hypothetical protein ACWD6P_18260 [Streptomyces sp. NPDC002446]